METRLKDSSQWQALSEISVPGKQCSGVPKKFLALHVFGAVSSARDRDEEKPGAIGADGIEKGTTIRCRG